MSWVQEMEWRDFRIDCELLQQWTVNSQKWQGLQGRLQGIWRGKLEEFKFNTSISINIFWECRWNHYYNRATVTIQNVCHQWKGEVVKRDEQADEELQVPKFDKEVSGYEVVRRYYCSMKIDDTNLSRPQHQEREILSLHDHFTNFTFMLLSIVIDFFFK